MSCHSSLSRMRMGSVMLNFKFMKTSPTCPNPFNMEAPTWTACNPLRSSATLRSPRSTRTRTSSHWTRTRTSRPTWSSSSWFPPSTGPSRSSSSSSSNTWRKDPTAHSIRSKRWCSSVRIYSHPCVKGCHNNHCKCRTRRRSLKYLTFCRLCRWTWKHNREHQSLNYKKDLLKVSWGWMQVLIITHSWH